MLDAKVAHMPELTPSDQAIFNTPWYHNFGSLGLATPQKGGIFPANQLAKEPVLFRLIDEAIRIARDHLGTANVVELFCADSLFGLYAVTRGADSLVGLDNGEERAGGVPIHLAQAELAARLLGVGAKASFLAEDVWNLEGSFDIGICAGGLYHIHDPKRLLVLLRSHIRGPLVIQTVVSLARTEADYFELSPRYRPHGCRFSQAWLEAAVRESGWNVEEQAFNELPGNEAPEDRGSVYMLCRQDAAAAR